MKGWIKLHRQLLKKGYADKPAYVSLWVHLLLLANHTEEHEFLWNDELIKLKVGQFVTGRKELSVKSGIPETTVERILKIFEKNAQIGQQKTSKYRLITILNWDKHQIVDNKRTTDGQQTDTFKNVKKEKKSAEAGSEELKANQDKMWKQQQEPEIDFSTGEIIQEPEKKKKVTSEMKLVFDLFNPKLAKLWQMREIERTSAQILYDEHGIETLTRRVNLAKAETKKGDQFFPIVDTPSKFLKAQATMERYFNQ